nr:retrovirus-related Pol polyprotein from transposon TNT 1-94 [Tanacetum cinerariifolium]
SGGFTRGYGSSNEAEINKKAHSAVILCLGNKVLREVTGETTVVGVWSKLETLYMTKSLANKLNLKKKLYTFYMPAGRKIFEHIDEFNKIVLDLANIEVKFKDEDLAEHFVDTLLYVHEALTLEDVMATLNSKEIRERSKAKGDDGEELYVRGITDRKDSLQSKGKSRSKSRGGRLKCYICQSEDHLKRNCPKNNCKKSTGYVKKDEQPSSSGSTYDDSQVMMVMSAQAHALLDWIMDSGCSYHMTPRLDILFEFLECDEGSVQLGDNRECKIRGIGKVRVQLKDGSSFVLHNVRDNCVYYLDGHAMAVELNANVEEKDSLTQFWCRKAHYLGSDRLCSFRLMGSVSGGIIGRFKHEAFGKFKEWKQLVDNQIGRTVKKPMTDNGLEFCNREFEQLCIESGIPRHLTVFETPQHNEVAERMNKTLMDKVHCLLIQSGLPKTFWAEATCTTAYLINRSPSRAIEKKTPIEMWLGHPSDYRMLRIFGCVTYPHAKQGKLDSRAAKCVLLGNVIFNESVMYKDMLKDSGASDKSVEELQVEVELQRLNNHALEEDQAYQEDGDDEDAGAEEEDTHESLTYQEAIACEDNSKWKAAMKEEMDSFKKNKTWELVDHPAGQKLVSCKWLFKIKERIEGVQKPRYKARLVARGFTQRACIDYNEVFYLIVRLTSIRVILALIACKDYELKQLDVKTTFLHENLEESPKQWYKRFDEYILNNGFKCSSYDNCVYYRSYAPGAYIYLLLYVDDMLIACKSKAEIGSTKSLLKKEFDMKELGEANKILGMEIVRDRIRKILRVSQSGYVSKILNNFRIDNRKSVKMPLGGHFKLSLKDCPVRDCDVERMSKVPYTNAVGLMYLMVCTRPDIAYAVNVVSRYLSNPGKNHWEAVKWILKYLRAGRQRLQHVVALSTTKAEYMALTQAVKQAIWLRGLLEELGVELNTVAFNCDNQGAIHLSPNHVVHERTKHINVIPGLKLQHCLELLNVGVANIKPKVEIVEFSLYFSKNPG